LLDAELAVFFLDKGKCFRKEQAQSHGPKAIAMAAGLPKDKRVLDFNLFPFGNLETGFYLLRRNRKE